MLNQREREELESLKTEVKKLQEGCESNMDVAEQLREIGQRLYQRSIEMGISAGQTILKLDSLMAKENKETKGGS